MRQAQHAADHRDAHRVLALAGRAGSVSISATTLTAIVTDVATSLAQSEDMHAGEIETSVLLHLDPHLVGEGYREADYTIERPDLLVLGLRAYIPTGVVGRP